MLLNDQKKHLILLKGTIKILAIRSIFAFHAKGAQLIRTEAEEGGTASFVQDGSLLFFLLSRIISERSFAFGASAPWPDSNTPEKLPVLGRAHQIIG